MEDLGLKSLAADCSPKKERKPKKRSFNPFLCFKQDDPDWVPENMVKEEKDFKSRKKVSIIGQRPEAVK